MELTNIRAMGIPVVELEMLISFFTFPFDLYTNHHSQLWRKVATSGVKVSPFIRNFNHDFEALGIFGVGKELHEQRGWR